MSPIIRTLKAAIRNDNGLSLWSRRPPHPQATCHRTRRLLLLGFLASLCLAAPRQSAAEDDGVYVIPEPRRTLEQIEEVYATMKPIEFKAPSGRWQHLPRTRARLLGGPSLRIVGLGDSIVNDLARSAFTRLVQRTHPDCDITMITCVRGSTGCWYFKESGRVQRYVLDHEPDLVLIGGISHRDDTESIREVVRQIRGQTDAEILLITGVFGRTDPTEAGWSETIPDDEKDFRFRLRRLAGEERVGFFDLQGPWGRYIRSAGTPLDGFKRDTVHANPRGEQILGRLMAIFLDARGD